MTQSLLQTKLYIPQPRPSLVARPHLIERLNAGLGTGPAACQTRLSLVAAPAGYGKTTLVADWVGWLLRETKPTGTPAVAWLSLDQHDNDCFRFLAYLVAAVQGVYPTFNAGWPTAPGPAGSWPDWQLIVEGLLNELAALPGRLVLVLDDFHVIDDPTVLAAVTSLVDYGPPNSHLVLTSRVEPALPVPRWRARQQLTEIRAADLRFDPAEASVFLRQTMGLAVDDKVVAGLEASTEGWVAGLQLAALALGSSGRSPGPLLDLSGRHPHIADYFMTEVFNRQPAAVQEFLLATCILERFCAPLCDRLLETDHSQTLLEQLEHNDLFLVPLDDRREWYRYHHLFGQLLLDRLERHRSAAGVAGLHQAAADWFAGRQLIPEAIDHAFRAGKEAQAARLMAAVPFYRLWEEGQAFQYQRWTKALPAAVRRSEPMTLILGAAAHMVTGEIRTGLDYLAQCAGIVAVQGEHRLLTSIILRNQGQIDQALTGLEAALPQLGQDQTVQTVANQQFAYCLCLSGRLQEADATLERLISLLETGDSRQLVNYLHASNMRALVARARGDYYRAYRHCQDGLSHAAPAGQPPHPLAGMIYSDLAEIHFQWNELDQAGRYADLAVTMGRRSGITDVLYNGLFIQADLAARRGDGPAAKEKLVTIRQSLVNSQITHLQAEFEAYEAGLDLRLGDLAPAGRWANASGLTLDQPPVFAILSRQILLAQVRLAELLALAGSPAADLPHRLLDYLQPIQTLAGRAGHGFFTIQTLLTQAVLLDELGQTGLALDKMADALTLARPGSLVRIFLDQRPVIDNLLHRVQGLDGLENFTTRLLLALEVERQPPLTGSGGRPGLAEPLTEREMEVLHHLAAGLTNREIEERLFISRNTVRSHIKNLYGKLGAADRTGAVRRARELRLL